MTDLYIVLFSIAALIICLVLAVNWWQERKFRQQVERSFTAQQADVLLHSHEDDAIAEVEDPFPPFDTEMLRQQIANENAAKVNAFSQTLGEFEDDEALYADINQKATLKTDKAALKQAPIEKHTPAEKARIEPQFGNISASDEDFTESGTTDVFGMDVAEDVVQTASAGTTGKSFGAEFSNDAPINSTAETTFNHAGLQRNADVTITPSVIADTTDALALTISLPPKLNGQIDLIALMYLAEDTPVREIQATLTNLLESYDKPTFVCGATLDGQWHTLEEIALLPTGHETMLNHVTCSLQLADRSGAVSRSTLNRFQLAVESAGLAINAHVAWQNTGDALTVANTLDAFCLEVDQTVRFHLKHGENGAFTGTKLRGLAEAQGFSIGANGAFHWIDATTNRTLFVMFNQDNHPFSPEMLRTSVVKGVTFELDIPHVKNCAEVFGQMVQVAHQMEVGLNAILVDDNQKLLGETQIEKIRQQLKIIHAKMLVQGIAPGSAEADRLFA